MRLNIEWVAPWLRGKPLRSWLWHTWRSPKGIIQGKPSWGVVVLGLHIMLTRDSKWSGIGISINV